MSHFGIKKKLKNMTFFWSLSGFFFQKKLVRQVIKLEWPNY